MRWSTYLSYVWQGLKGFLVTILVLVVITVVIASGVKDVVSKGLEKQIDAIKAQNQRSLEDRAEIKDRLDRIERALEN